MTVSAPTPPLSIGEAARRLGVPTWAVRRLYERGLLPPAPRFGSAGKGRRGCRVVAEADLPTVEAALRQASYLRGAPQGVPA